MVALVLLAAALMAATDLAGAALRNHEMARDLNAAVLLARGRMAQVEEQYEDQGFKDSDESDQGDFSAEGWPGFRWKLEVLRPAPSLTADQVVGLLTGATGSGSADELAKKLMGGAAGAGGAGLSPAGGGQALALLSTALQAQVTGFAEKVKRSLREMRLTVSWSSGKKASSFTIVTHLVVLNPRAPGGARGDSPDVPAALAAPVAVVPPAGSTGVPGLPVAPPGFRPGSTVGVPPPTAFPRGGVTR
ncbi:MAG: prepilin-type cleavage/methylation domain-containing protein [Deltaproteobacteria bacterium]|nr:prepilin-type cleavage/methylation domain-containing protein [Deltaproteobacteria bacterium]